MLTCVIGAHVKIVKCRSFVFYDAKTLMLKRLNAQLARFFLYIYLFNIMEDFIKSSMLELTLFNISPQIHHALTYKY
jgi:hypothetical protein